jgi:TldD protein
MRFRLFRGHAVEDIAEKAVDHALRMGAEFADIRIESVSGTNVVVMDGKTKTVTAQIESGAGIRAFVGGAWGFAVTNDLRQSSVRSAAASACKMAKAARLKVKIKFKMDSGKAVTRSEKYACRERPSDVPVEEKLAYALAQDRSMKRLDDRIVSTNARYDDFEGEWVVANSFGTRISTRETWTLAACSAWSKAEGVMQRGHSTVGNVGGYELIRQSDSQALGKTAADMAVRLLDSKPVPAGKFTVVLDNKMTGLLAHEAFGHACEADAILAGASVLIGKVGEKVADEQVSLIDDPTIKSTFGYFSYDWEGVKARKHVLIENGVLKGYMHNLETGSRMNLQSNGAARAQAFFNTPIIRMSNTYIAGGEWKKDEMIAETKDGLLIQGSQYGYVEPAKGQFMFKCDEAYEIRKGEIGRRFRDASLSGEILQVLMNVKCVADDFKIVDPGYCGKNGQEARTTDGGPHISVSDVVVGGLA